MFLRDAQGRTIGEITGETNWDWLYVDCFWLPDDLRGGGWGARLLAAAEGEARERSCRHVRLFSYSFQAPGFYESSDIGSSAYWRIIRPATPRSGCARICEAPLQRACAGCVGSAISCVAGALAA